VAQLAVQKSDPTAPAAVALVAASGGGDSFPAGTRRCLHVKNADASSKTVTIHSQKKCDQGATHDVAVVVAAGAEKRLGPYSPSRFADVNGLVQVTYSAVTSVTVACEEI
jgi:hypothetical protein